MTEQQLPSVLVAYPPAFASYSLFEQKVSRILSNMERFRLYYPDDCNKLISRYFATDMRLLEAGQCPDGEGLGTVTHAIVFDDKQSFQELLQELQKTEAKVRRIEVLVTRVVNIDKGEKFDVYIGRGSKWGNPYAIGVDGDRDEVIRKYRYDFERGFLRFSKAEVSELRGKVLGCHCKPAACHGDVLVDYLQGSDEVV